MITCALFTLTLVDERLFPDARNQAVLASLLLIEEARLEGDWRYDEARARSQVGSMLVRARLQAITSRNNLVESQFEPLVSTRYHWS